MPTSKCHPPASPSTGKNRPGKLEVGGFCCWWWSRLATNPAKIYFPRWPCCWWLNHITHTLSLSYFLHLPVFLFFFLSSLSRQTSNLISSTRNVLLFSLSLSLYPGETPPTESHNQPQQLLHIIPRVGREEPISCIHPLSTISAPPPSHFIALKRAQREISPLPSSSTSPLSLSLASITITSAIGPIPPPHKLTRWHRNSNPPARPSQNLLLPCPVKRRQTRSTQASDLPSQTSPSLPESTLESTTAKRLVAAAASVTSHNTPPEEACRRPQVNWRPAQQIARRCCAG